MFCKSGHRRKGSRSSRRMAQFSKTILFQIQINQRIREKKFK